MHTVSKLLIFSACQEEENQKRNKNIRKSTRWNKCYSPLSYCQRPSSK